MVHRAFFYHVIISRDFSFLLSTLRLSGMKWNIFFFFFNSYYAYLYVRTYYYLNTHINTKYVHSIRHTEATCRDPARRDEKGTAPAGGVSNY